MGLCALMALSGTLQVRTRWWQSSHIGGRAYDELHMTAWTTSVTTTQMIHAFDDFSQGIIHQPYRVTPVIAVQPW
jgi:hypothetical protein